jgi:hypothetical protein
VLIVLVPLALVVGCGSSGQLTTDNAASSQSSVSNDSLDTSAPLPDVTSAPTANPLVTWYQTGGASVMNSLTAVLGSVSTMDPTDPTAALAACENLGTTVSTAQGYAPIPDTLVQAHWSAALTHFKNASDDCVAGIKANDTSTITFAGAELDEGTSELNAASSAITSGS